MDFKYPEGATPLDADEVQGLRLTHITTRKELDIWEQQNIQKGIDWAFGGREKDILSELVIRKLHRQMFGDVWKWAGEFRKTNKNIGVFSERIGIELRKLCDDVAYWIENSSYGKAEIAFLFHHRLVAIHPFSNGNGRHARVITDLLLEKQLDSARFSWGGETLNDSGECRERYIAALRAADKGDYTLLAEFVRS